MPASRGPRLELYDDVDPGGRPFYRHPTEVLGVRASLVERAGDDVW